MRGAPFLLTIFMVAAFLLAGVPVYRLTRPTSSPAVADKSTAADPAPDNPELKAIPLEVEVWFAPAPAEFQLKNLDRTVLAGRGPQARFNARWTVAVPTEGVDLVLQAHWPATAAGSDPAAARVTVRFPDGRQAEKSFWAGANGTLEDVLTVPGAPATAAP